MGMQVPLGVDSEIPEKDVIQAASKGIRPSVPAIGLSEGERNRRGGYESGSCSHVGIDSAEVFRRASGRVCERQECDLGRKGDRAEPEFCGSEFLGSGVLCINHLTGREDDPGVHPGAGRGR